MSGCNWLTSSDAYILLFLLASDPATKSAPQNLQYHPRRLDLAIGGFGFSESNRRIPESMASAFRDRTSEFRSLSDTLKKIGGITAADRAENVPVPSSTSPPVSSSRSEFNKKASRIGLGIHETSLKIARLAQCMYAPFYISSRYCLAAGKIWVNKKSLNFWSSG